MWECADVKHWTCNQNEEGFREGKDWYTEFYRIQQY